MTYINPDHLQTPLEQQFQQQQDTLAALREAIQRNPQSIRATMLRNRLRNTHGMSDAMIDSELENA